MTKVINVNIIFYNSEVENMSMKNNKKLIFGVVSAVAGVVAGVCFKNNMN